MNKFTRERLTFEIFEYLVIGHSLVASRTAECFSRRSIFKPVLGYPLNKATFYL